MVRVFAFILATTALAGCAVPIGPRRRRSVDAGRSDSVAPVKRRLAPKPHTARSASTRRA